MVINKNKNSVTLQLYVYLSAFFALNSQKLLFRLSGKDIEVPLQNVHIPVTVGNIVTFSFLYTPQAKRALGDTVLIHRVRHDVDWFNNTISIEKSMYFSYLNLTDSKKIL
jgi:hypothetical protein